MFLRPGSACDPDSLCRLFEGCQENPRLLPVPDASVSLPVWMAQIGADARAGTSHLWVMEAKPRRAVGAIRIGHIDVRRRRGQLSYWVAPPYRGRGYATAAGQVALSFAFAGAGLERIDTWIEGSNLASRKVARRLGFRRVGQADAESPVSAYVLLARDFQPLPGADMLIIRESQWNAFRLAEMHSFTRQCVRETERRFPDIIAGMGGREQAIAIADAAVSRAIGMGFGEPAEIRAFLQFALCIGPYFDQYPRIRELLTAPGREPAQRLASLDELVTAEDWQRAARHRLAASA